MAVNARGLDAETASAYPKVTYHNVKVDGLDIFYREAGNPIQPTVPLLHGFPTSSHMFRELIPALAGMYHVVAPDYPGYGHSSVPDAAGFNYTFDHLARVLESTSVQIGCTTSPFTCRTMVRRLVSVGFRIAAKHPEWVRGLIIQNGNAYEGFGPVFDALHAFWKNRSDETEEPIRGVLTLDGTKFQYLHGTRAPAATSPDDWTLAQQLLDRPGNVRIQLDIFYDYRNNPPRYPGWQAYFRKYQPPTLIVWGKNDPFFPETGARAYLRDLPRAALHLLDGPLRPRRGRARDPCAHPEIPSEASLSELFRRLRQTVSSCHPFRSELMAGRFLEAYFTPEVLAAPAHYYGRSQAIPPQPERDAFGAEEAEFIAHSDSGYMAALTSDGWPYIQHRRGPTGSLKMLDPQTLGFADLKGNRQLLSTGNVAASDRASLFLMDYPRRERLKSSATLACSTPAKSTYSRMN